MIYFNGKNLSLINDEIPKNQRKKEHFLADRKQEIIEAETMFNEDDIKMATEIVLLSFYDTYEWCLDIINQEETLSPEQKEKMQQRLNLVLTNLLEFWQRSNKNIIRSLLDRKLSKSETGWELFNDIIDLLIQTLNKANIEFHQKQEDFYKNKRKLFKENKSQ